MYTSKIAVCQGDHYKLISYGNGTFYSLHHGGKSVGFQGQDADILRGEWELIEMTHPDWSPDQCLEWLWDQCDYGSVAQED